jgi:hypothetical protein
MKIQTPNSYILYHITHTNFKSVTGGDVMKKCNIFPPTGRRVFMRTDPQTNADIRNQTIKNLNVYKNCGEPEITDRIHKLNQEWDTERVLEVNASLLIFLSSYLGIKTSRAWFLMTGAVAVFMLQHAFWGWCPPLPLIRKWGVRTIEEIHDEITALKVMRSDFKAEAANVEDALNMAEKQ